MRSMFYAEQSFTAALPGTGHTRIAKKPERNSMFVDAEKCVSRYVE